MSNQGEVVVTTEEGVVYTLRYGDVVTASGLEPHQGGGRIQVPKRRGRTRRSPPRGRPRIVTCWFPFRSIRRQSPVRNLRSRNCRRASRTTFSRRTPPTPSGSRRRRPSRKRPTAKRPTRTRRSPMARNRKGARRPVRRLVLRHSRRQLQVNRPQPRRLDPDQASQAGTPRVSRQSFVRIPTPVDPGVGESLSGLVSPWHAGSLPSRGVRLRRAIFFPVAYASGVRFSSPWRTPPACDFSSSVAYASGVRFSLPWRTPPACDFFSPWRTPPACDLSSPVAYASGVRFLFPRGVRLRRAISSPRGVRLRRAICFPSRGVRLRRSIRLPSRGVRLRRAISLPPWRTPPACDFFPPVAYASGVRYGHEKTGYLPRAAASEPADGGNCLPRCPQASRLPQRGRPSCGDDERGSTFVLSFVHSRRFR